MIYALLSHFGLAKPDRWTYETRELLRNTEAPRIRCIAHVLGDPLDSVGLVLLSKMASDENITNDELLTLLDSASRELLDHRVGEFTPDEALRLQDQLLSGALSYGVSLTSEQRFRLIGVVGEGIKQAWGLPGKLPPACCGLSKLSSDRGASCLPVHL